MNIYWRIKGTVIWHFGYKTSAGSGLVRMGLWAGDTTNGPLLDPADTETRPYRRQKEQQSCVS